MFCEDEGTEKLEQSFCKSYAKDSINITFKEPDTGQGAEQFFFRGTFSEGNNPDNVLFYKSVRTYTSVIESSLFVRL